MSKVASEWWTIPLGVGAAVLLVWLALMAALWLAKPDDVGLADMARLLPDVLRLLKSSASTTTGNSPAGSGWCPSSCWRCSPRPST